MGGMIQLFRKWALQIPLFWIALSAMAGILAADLHWSWLWIPVAIAGVFFQKKRASLLLVVGMLIASTGFMLIHSARVDKIHQFPLLEAIQSNRSIGVSGTGWICSDTNRRTGQSVRVILELKTLSVRGSEIAVPNRDRVVALIDHPASADLHYGEEVRFSGRIAKIDSAKSPGAFDPAVYFYRSANAVAELNINGGDRCIVTGENFGSAMMRQAIRSRQWMEKALAHGVRKSHLEMNGVILAMALGAREKSPDDVEDFFRLSGTMHIFAVSGLHVGVVAGMFWFLLKWLGLSRRSAVIIIIPAVLFYALLTGLRPSSFRAAVMLSVFLAGFALKRKPSPINGIGLAAVILLAFNTQQVFLPGFQLSFAVVLALSLAATFFSDKIYEPFQIDEFIPKRRVALWRSRTDKLVRGLTVGAGVSVASWLGSVILMNSHFSGIAPVGLLANIVMVPIASAIVVIAGVSILFFALHLGVVSVGLNYINLYLASFLAFLAQTFAEFPGAHIHTGQGAPVIEEELISLDVMGLRGGGSILATSKSRTWMLDTGGNLTFRQQVLPLLRDRGINHLDCLILSHGDSGHIGAAPYLLNHLTPDLVIESPLPNRARIYPEINSIIEKRKINRVNIVAGQKLRWSDDVYWDPLYPGQKDPPTGVADDRCLVMRLRAGRWKILFTFDAGMLVERELLADGQNLQSDIWIRGQHSTTRSGTSEFLDRVAPKVIVSTHDRFPPHEKLSEEWIRNVHDSGIKLITLDQAGTVSLQLTKDRVVIKSFITGETITLP